MFFHIQNYNKKAAGMFRQGNEVNCIITINNQNPLIRRLSSKELLFSWLLKVQECRITKEAFHGSLNPSK